MRMGGNSSRGWYRPDHSKTASDGPAYNSGEFINEIGIIRYI